MKVGFSQMSSAFEQSNPKLSQANFTASNDFCNLKGNITVTNLSFCGLFGISNTCGEKVIILFGVSVWAVEIKSDTNGVENFSAKCDFTSLKFLGSFLIISVKTSRILPS